MVSAAGPPAGCKGYSCPRVRDTLADRVADLSHPLAFWTLGGGTAYYLFAPSCRPGYRREARAIRAQRGVDMVALTDAQIAQFCRDGVLHIPGFFSPEQIEEWRIQTYDHSAADPADPTTWPGGGSTGVGRYLHRADDPEIQARLAYPYEGLPHTFTGVVREGRGPAVDPRPVSPAIGETQLGDIVDQLLGLENVADGLRPGPENDTMVIQWPKPEEDCQPREHRQWGAPQSGHIEGYNPTKGGWKGGFLLGALTYLEDVETSGCGAFYYWPGSHLPLQRFFHANPGRLVDGCPLDPAAPDNPARGNAPVDALIDTHGTWCTDVLNEHCPGGYSRQPREWLAPAGDLLLW